MALGEGGATGRRSSVKHRTQGAAPGGSRSSGPAGPAAWAPPACSPLVPLAGLAAGRPGTVPPVAVPSASRLPAAAPRPAGPPSAAVRPVPGLPAAGLPGVAPCRWPGCGVPWSPGAAVLAALTGAAGAPALAASGWRGGDACARSPSGRAACRGNPLEPAPGRPASLDGCAAGLVPPVSRYRPHGRRGRGLGPPGVPRRGAGSRRAGTRRRIRATVSPAATVAPGTARRGSPPGTRWGPVRRGTAPPRGALPARRAPAGPCVRPVAVRAVRPVAADLARAGPSAGAGTSVRRRAAACCGRSASPGERRPPWERRPPRERRAWDPPPRAGRPPRERRPPRAGRPRGQAVRRRASVRAAPLRARPALRGTAVGGRAVVARSCRRPWLCLPAPVESPSAAGAPQGLGMKMRSRQMSIGRASRPANSGASVATAPDAEQRRRGVRGRALVAPAGGQAEGGHVGAVGGEAGKLAVPGRSRSAGRPRRRRARARGRTARAR